MDSYFTSKTIGLTIAVAVGVAVLYTVQKNLKETTDLVGGTIVTTGNASDSSASTLIAPHPPASSDSSTKSGFGKRQRRRAKTGSSKGLRHSRRVGKSLKKLKKDTNQTKNKVSNIDRDLNTCEQNLKDGFADCEKAMDLVRYRIGINEHHINTYAEKETGYARVQSTNAAHLAQLSHDINDMERRLYKLENWQFKIDRDTEQKDNTQ